MPLPILVTGGTGTLGQQVVAAVQHVGTIVHCASNRKGDAQATLGRRTWPDFLTSTTREVFRGV